jgi:hypothetical protein
MFFPRLVTGITEEMICRATFGLNIVVIALMAVPSDAIWHTLFITPHVALESAMACTVFRSLILGLIMETDSSVTQFSTQQPHFPAVMASADGSGPSGNFHHLPTVVKISEIAESTEPESYPVGGQKGEHDNSDVILDCF